MAKNGAKDPIAKARKRVARAQSSYTKAVAKSEREIRNVRALADERIARAKAQFELRASELADLDASAAAGAELASSQNGKAADVQPTASRKRKGAEVERSSSPKAKAAADTVTAMPKEHGDPELASTNGAMPRPVGRDSNGRFATGRKKRSSSSNSSGDSKQDKK